MTAFRNWLDSSRIVVWATMALAGGLVGLAYVALVYPVDGGGDASPWLGFFIGLCIGTLVAGFELVFVTHPYSAIRRLSFIPALLVRVAAQFLIISASIALFQIGYDRLYGTQLFVLTKSGVASHFKDVSFSLIVSGAIVFYMQMRMYIGSATLPRLLLGIYNHPVAEERIFMILDIPGTTTAAQTIGDIAFHRYLNQLFILFDRPILRNGGEVHSYVGDAVIAVWPLTTDRKVNARVLRALERIVAICRDEASRVEKRFGIRPGVRAAIHGGSVVVGESGDSKRQITYLGDVMNIASRIESKAKELDRPLLISSELLARMDLPSGFAAEPIGAYAVKGSRRKIALTELRIS